MNSSVVYKITFLKQPIKVLQKLPKDLFRRINRAIQGLAAEPRPVGCKKLVGKGNLYRIREGDWRIAYAIEDERLIIVVVEVSPRGGAYRNL